jgi:hypothetical protein
MYLISVDIKKHDLGVAFLKSNYGCYTESVLSCLRDRIKAASYSCTYSIGDK